MRFIEKDKPKEKTPWQELIEKNASLGAVLYFFTSDQCGFCKKAHPWVEAIENKYGGMGLSVFAVSTDDNVEISASADVTGVPVFILVKNGIVINRSVGWGIDAQVDIEESIGLTSMFQVEKGLAIKQELSTCTDCEKTENAAVAELAENIAKELDQIRLQIAEIRDILKTIP